MPQAYWLVPPANPSSEALKIESPGGPLAQLVEQLTLNQRAVGSTPTRPTKQTSHLDSDRSEHFEGMNSGC